MDERPQDTEPVLWDEHSGASTTSRPAEHAPLSNLQVRSDTPDVHRERLAYDSLPRAAGGGAGGVAAAVVSAVQPLPLEVRGDPAPPLLPPEAEAAPAVADPILGPDTETPCKEPCSAGQVAPAPVTLAPAGSEPAEDNNDAYVFRNQPWAEDAAASGPQPAAEPDDTARAESSTPAPQIAAAAIAAALLQRDHDPDGHGEPQGPEPMSISAAEPAAFAPDTASPPAPAEADTVQSAAPSAVPDTGANSEPAVLAQIPLVVLDPPRNSAFAPVVVPVFERAEPSVRPRGEPLPPPLPPVVPPPLLDIPEQPPTATPLPLPSRPAPRTGGSRLRRFLRLAVMIAAALAGVVLTLAVLYRWVDPPMSTLMLGQRLTGTPINQRWLPLERISPNLQLAVILSEDGHFCRHHGVDWGELKEAIESTGDGFARGGSTISMQVVKNLFLWPSRSYLRKGLEIPLAFTIEAMWPKRRVLEIYLNIAEWGPGIFGAEAAARHHFRKSALLLTPREAALLAVSLPNPFERQAGRPGPGTQRLADNLLLRMRAAPGNAYCTRRSDGG